MNQHCNSFNINQIYHYYTQLGEKKLLKSIIKDLNLNKHIFLYYSKFRKIPICALPKMRLIFASRKSFIQFYYDFIYFTNINETIIFPTKQTVECVAKYIIYHEIGHILDPDINTARDEYKEILTSIIDKILVYDIDISNISFYKNNIPYDLEDLVLKLKRNVIVRETKAWDIARDLCDFNSEYEEIIFNKIKHYAIATYNFSTLKTIISDHNIETFFKYRKYLKE